ncbi:MAG: HAMP domain-containing protein [Saprospiraceae bacterium]|nr:HAMP domain-containing protein [Saprospiraceae bacterium]
MFRKLLIPLFLFVLIFIIDFVSYSSRSLVNSEQQISSYVEDVLEAHRNLLFQAEILSLFAEDSLTNNELGRIKRLEEQFQSAGIQLRLYQNSTLVFWSNFEAQDTVCYSYVSNEYTLDICKALTDAEGNILLDVKRKSILAKKRGSHYIELNKLLLDRLTEADSINFDRHSSTNLIFLIFYLLSFFLLILSTLHHQNYWGILFASVLRVLLRWSGGIDRLTGIELAESLFLKVNYSGLELIMDSVLILSALAAILQTKNISKKASAFQVYLDGGFFLLLTLSHIRIIQLLTFSDKVFNDFNDLAALTKLDTLSLISILVIQIGIFIFGLRFFKSLQEQSVNKYWHYGFLGIMSLLGTLIALILRLDINPFILFFFLAAYFLLFDLFVDVKSKNITWIIWWAIFFSVYLAALLFNFDIKSQIQSREQFLESALHVYPIDEIKESNTVQRAERAVEELRKLLILPNEATYDQEDILGYLVNKFDVDPRLIEVEKFNQFNIIGQNSFRRTIDLLSAINDSTFHNPVQNIVWYRKRINSDYTLNLGFKFPSSKTRPHPFNYYVGGEILYQGMALTQEELRSINETEEGRLTKRSTSYVLHRPGPDQLLVSKISFGGLIKPIALFSFLFCFIILLAALFSIVHRIYAFLPEDWPFRISGIESLNAKIQISLILVILLSFIIIASITNSFLKNYLTQEKDAFYQNKISSIANALGLNSDQANDQNELLAIHSNYENDVEQIHNVELNVFDIDDPKLDYFTYSYFNHHAPLKPFTDRSTNPAESFFAIEFQNRPVGVVQIKHSRSLNEKSYVFDFLGSIFNVYVFLFLIASVIAIFIARSITRPLSILNEKLLELKLGKRNELIDWDRDDEIGNLINNYNNMVNQLEESANILAKTERDSAWREMAKQVAHEIKNPLTPMKLSIQYLEKAIKQSPEKAQEIAKRISSTLLEQIENLTEIANAFSNFAELPQSSNVKIEVNEVVELVHNLFRKREDMDITLSEPIDPIYVYADKNQLIRILNNLVKNATEAIPIDRKGKIELKLEQKLDKAIIKVSDNGVGISEDMKDKIFQPKFTTKDSGSGLGLAICANMIDSMNGRLYFESTEGKGTDFFIELDIIRKSFYEDQNKRITLD